MPKHNRNGPLHWSKIGDNSIPEHDKTLQLENWVQCAECKCKKWRLAPAFLQPVLIHTSTHDAAANLHIIGLANLAADPGEFTCDKWLGGEGCDTPEDTTWLDIHCFSGAASKSTGLEHVYVKNALRALLYKLEGYVHLKSWPESRLVRTFETNDSGVWDLKPYSQREHRTNDIVNFGLEKAQDNMTVDDMRKVFKRILPFVPVMEEDELLEHWKQIHQVHSPSSFCYSNPPLLSL